MDTQLLTFCIKYQLNENKVDLELQAMNQAAEDRKRARGMDILRGACWYLSRRRKGVGRGRPWITWRSDLALQNKRLNTYRIGRGLFCQGNEGKKESQGERCKWQSPKIIINSAVKLLNSSNNNALMQGVVGTWYFTVRSGAKGEFAIYNFNL